MPSEINSTELMRLSEGSLLSKADFGRTVYEYLGTKPSHKTLESDSTQILSDSDLIRVICILMRLWKR